jgi:L-asparaginase II
VLDSSVVPLAYLTRSGLIESVHHGSAIVLDADGTELISLGKPGTPMLPRSALKPLQLLAMLRSGLSLADAELVALASASHSGEPFHQAGVDRILAGAGLGEEVLQNTPDLPLGEAERVLWQRLRRPATAKAQNCSGKHAAMLATCVVNGWPLESYLDPGHPLQVRIAETVADLAGEPVAASAVDGCGAPALSISLTGLARAFAALASAAPDSPEGLVAAAVRAQPQWLGGTGREVTALILAVPGLIAKDGAEGVYAAALPDGRAVALKIADGSNRPRQAVMAALLLRLDLADDAVAALTLMSSQPVLGHGRPVGSLEPVKF